MFPAYPVLHPHSKINSRLKCKFERMAVLETCVLPSHINWFNPEWGQMKSISFVVMQNQIQYL